MLACTADVLAGESEADEVDGAEVVGSDESDVFMVLGLRPVLGEESTAERIDFAGPGGLAEAGPFKAQLKQAYAAAQRADAHGYW